MNTIKAEARLNSDPVPLVMTGIAVFLMAAMYAFAQASVNFGEAR